MKPVIFGMAGEALTVDERALFAEADPAGYILFARNIAHRAQLRALTDSLREVSGRENVPILIDQEGGSVARMKPPEWPAFPAGPAFDALYDIAPISAIEAARVNAQAIAMMLAEVGITVNCLPLLDIGRPETTPAIAMRAYGREPLRVAAMGRVVLEGLASGGVVGVVKHMPGHGRAMVDSHHELPTVTASEAELEDDLTPFRALSGAPMGMTSHIVFETWDADRPATLSPVVIGEIIRGRIGFDGLLITDDLDMKALRGLPAELAARAVAAGCDLALNCWGRLDEMAATVEALDDISEAALERLDRAITRDDGRLRYDDFRALIDKRDQLLAYA